MSCFYAGAAIDPIIELLTLDNDEEQNRHTTILLKILSSFDAFFDDGNEGLSTYTPWQALFLNWLQRGLPTRLNAHAAKVIAESSPLLTWTSQEKDFGIRYSDKLPHNHNAQIFQALHIVDPRIEPGFPTEHHRRNGAPYDSGAERDFIQKYLPKSLPEYKFIGQLLATQRLFNSIKSIIGHEDQRIDFCIEWPYQREGQVKGKVLEVDGPHHTLAPNNRLDINRDYSILMNAKWQTTDRFPVAEFGSTHFSNRMNELRRSLEPIDFINRTAESFRNPIYQTTEGRQVLEITVVPFGIARVQRIIIESIATGRLSLAQKSWDICIIERDVPCGIIAFEDFQETVQHWCEISGNVIEIPHIQLTVFSTAEFINSEIHSSENAPLPIEDFNAGQKYDLLIDISILERTGWSIAPKSNSRHVVTIRSAHYQPNDRVVITEGNVDYLPLSVRNDQEEWNDIDVTKKHLEYFLQSFFRRAKFRDGQIPILHKALSNSTVIGILPTGGGKSMIFQLATLMQPGIGLIVAPLRSLMSDQVAELKAFGIDSCTFINSTQSRNEKVEAVSGMESGLFQFVFIAPERMVMVPFRQALIEMERQKRSFAYCILDEVHCVSEWGHDFRPSYLRLGDNAIRFCRSLGKDRIPIIGLTATASFDVLADVQRELSGSDVRNRLDEDVIVRLESVKRHELQFLIREVDIELDYDDEGEEIPFKNEWDVKKRIQTIKKQEALKALNDIPRELEKFQLDPELASVPEPTSKFEPSSFWAEKSGDVFEHSAIVFCPHARGGMGVTDSLRQDVAIKSGFYDQDFSTQKLVPGFFIGGDDESAAKQSIANQMAFKSGRSNLIVATKAFGMGINKNNVRATIHLNYPASIESFVQEAGRAGRDRKMAVAIVLFNNQKLKVRGGYEPYNYDYEINNFFHRHAFLGEDKEWAVLDELLSKIDYPNRTFEVEWKLAEVLSDATHTAHNLWLACGEGIRCEIASDGPEKRLLFRTITDVYLGRLILTDEGLTENLKDCANVNLAAVIMPIARNYILLKAGAETPNVWIQQKGDPTGIETRILRPGPINESFQLTIGTTNNLEKHKRTLKELLGQAIHPNFNNPAGDADWSDQITFNGFLEKIKAQYKAWRSGDILDFERSCANFDTAKNAKEGTTIHQFQEGFLLSRRSPDTAKALCRLVSVGIIDDYTIDYSKNTYQVHFRRRTEADYKQAFTYHFSKYLAPALVAAELEKAETLNEPTFIRKSLRTLVKFTYAQIKRKREIAIGDMRQACVLGLENGNLKLKEHIDLYFNSKYARESYSFMNSQEEDEPASLVPLLKEGNEEPIETLWYLMDVMERDSSGTFKENIKHLRGATIRLKQSAVDNPIINLLKAFAILLIEPNNPIFLQEAMDEFYIGFKLLNDRSAVTIEDLEDWFNEFVRRIDQKDSSVKNNLVKHGLSFDFSLISVYRLKDALLLANETLDKIQNSLL